MSLRDSSTHPASFYPPVIKPAAKPLRFPFNLSKMFGNNLEAIPEQAYHEPLVFAPGPPRMAFITGAEFVKKVLLTHPDECPKHSSQVESMRPMFGNSIFTLHGDDWRWQRGAAAPFFRHENLLQFGPAIFSAADQTVENWKSSPDGSVHPVNLDMMRATFRVISSTMLANEDKDLFASIETGYSEYYLGLNWRIIYVTMGLPHWFPHPRKQAMQTLERKFRRAVTELVRARRENAKDDSDMISRLLRASNPETGDLMSEDQLVNNIIAFIIGGYETTASTLTWALYLISQSPEWEERMLAEIERVAGDLPITAGHVEDLATVRQVLNETMRLFPAVPVFAREILRDMDFDGICVPAGTMAVIPVYVIHRHRSYWSEPDRFDPGRFSSEKSGQATRYHFMPFGAGPRVCVGAAFAAIETTIMLATFIRAAHFDLAPDFHPQPFSQVVLFPKNGMQMRVTMRRDMH